jgi:hypothetical protein
MIVDDEAQEAHRLHIEGQNRIRAHIRERAILEARHLYAGAVAAQFTPPFQFVCKTRMILEVQKTKQREHFAQAPFNIKCSSWFHINPTAYIHTPSGTTG